MRALVGQCPWSPVPVYTIYPGQYIPIKDIPQNDIFEFESSRPPLAMPGQYGVTGACLKLRTTCTRQFRPSIHTARGSASAWIAMDTKPALVRTESRNGTGGLFYRGAHASPASADCARRLKEDEASRNFYWVGGNADLRFPGSEAY